MSLNQRIFDLMDVRQEAHDLPWLKRSLQAAIEVEFFTIPPYLAALWSIKNTAHPVYESIKEIVIKEEMLHFGLMCNLLTALGEVPKINVRANVPTYPHNLPGSINPNLIVELRGLSDEALDKFMALELPENGSLVEEASGAMSLNEEFSTIGAFYTAILEAFERNLPVLSPSRQIERLPFGLFKITTMEKVREAVAVIKRQGEGANGSPGDSGDEDLAHYYRFGEIRFRKKMKKDALTGEWKFNGDDVEFPEVFPMAVVPPGGYQSGDVPADVRQALETFDHNYTDMLNRLQAAWQGGSLGGAVAAMFSLEEPAIELMTKEILNGRGNYGPCFRLV